MNLSALLQKRLLFISGKGGVGKTTLSVLLALFASRQNKKILIVEMNSSGRVAPLFGVRHIDHRVIPLTPLVSVINIKPEQCFEEYALKLIYFSKLYSTIFMNSYVSNFIKALPGLDEFQMMSKICDLTNEKKHRFTPQLKYDLIIVDAPATGHGLSVLEVPSIIASAVKFGPPHKQALKIMDLMGDHAKTAFCLVTLPEEMPICESEEYVAALRKRTQLNFGPMFVNAIMPPPPKIPPNTQLPANLAFLLDYYTFSRERFALHQHYLQEIEQRFPDLTKIHIPFQFKTLKSTKNFDALQDALLTESPTSD